MLKCNTPAGTRCESCESAATDKARASVTVRVAQVARGGAGELSVKWEADGVDDAFIEGFHVFCELKPAETTKADAAAGSAAAGAAAPAAPAASSPGTVAGAGAGSGAPATSQDPAAQLEGYPLYVAGAGTRSASLKGLPTDAAVTVSVACVAGGKEGARSAPSRPVVAFETTSTGMRAVHWDSLNPVPATPLGSDGAASASTGASPASGDWARFGPPDASGSSKVVYKAHVSTGAAAGEHVALLVPMLPLEDAEVQTYKLMCGDGSGDSTVASSASTAAGAGAVTGADADGRHFVELLGVCEDAPPCPRVEHFTGVPQRILVLKWAAGGSLEGQLKEWHANHIEPDAGVLLRIARQVAQAMAQMASRKYCHCDLACRNVLLTRGHASDPSQVDAVLTDFGMSEIRVNTLSTSLSRGDAGLPELPCRIHAPETINTNKFTEGSDVFSFGVLLWQLYSSGSDPWTGLSNAQVKEAVVNDGKRLARPDRCPDVIWELIQMCWRPRTPETPTLDRPRFASIAATLHNLEIDYSVYGSSAWMECDILALEKHRGAGAPYSNYVGSGSLRARLESVGLAGDPLAAAISALEAKLITDTRTLATALQWLGPEAPHKLAVEIGATAGLGEAEKDKLAAAFKD